MLAGLDKDDMQKTISIADRREAIKTACMLAQPGDVILVAGKGHENYQEVKGVKHHFDDKEELNRIMNWRIMNYELPCGTHTAQSHSQFIIHNS